MARSPLSRVRHWLKDFVESDGEGADATYRSRLEALVGESIGDVQLYRLALRHRSVLRSSREGTGSNERLEFLGDAILGMVVAEYLFERFRDADEGFLTKLRAKLVNGHTLARCARDIDLGSILEISENMDRIEGRTNKSILSDAYEAIVGAIYLDRGIDSARRFLHRTLLTGADLTLLASRRDNHKSLLLEFCQARSWPQPSYEVTAEEGPDHEKQFTVRVVVNGKPAGTGTASSKKSAEQIAARNALGTLGTLSPLAFSPKAANTPGPDETQ